MLTISIVVELFVILPSTTVDIYTFNYSLLPVQPVSIGTSSLRILAVWYLGLGQIVLYCNSIVKYCNTLALKTSQVLK